MHACLSTRLRPAVAKPASKHSRTSRGGRGPLAVTARLAAVTNRSESAALAAEYNLKMTEMMKWSKDDPYSYKPERGLYYHFITEQVVVGSQPMTAGDVDKLADIGVTCILNLQQDKDLAYWKVDFNEISSRAAARGVDLVRTPAVDFDPNSLRATLPSAVAALERAHASGHKVYVHCTAGLGRSPAVAIAFLYWCSDHLNLDDAYSYLTTIRPCGPNKEAIRGATYDLLGNGSWHDFQHLPQDAFAYLSDDDRVSIRSKLPA